MNITPPSDDFAAFLFHQGTNYTAYNYLGAHRYKSGVIFRTWAPHASAVSVVGDFNYWTRGQYPMFCITSGGVWEGYIENIDEYTTYKFAVTDARSNTIDKADPYAFHSETRPNTATKFYDIDKGYAWSDDAWMLKRSTHNPYQSPMNIYELSAASWKKHWDNNYYSYGDIAAHLVPYIKKMGYTHVEFMPLTEYPFDMSWGYQVSGYFAATSRFGGPEGLQYLINELHRADIGVIMDWVPAHFPKDEFALYKFDGDCCYEYSDQKKRENPDWGTHQFDYGKPEVESFLVSSASFWFDKYHIDGLRVDAVAAMLYLDYSRHDGQWEPNSFGGNGNLEAIALFKKLNSHVFGAFPGILMIAEESTNWPKVTMPVEYGGLGFNFKWNMGWMNDTLRYFETPTIYRKYHHDMLTHTFLFAFTENYILPVSHDEVVYGKGSLINKMPGDYWQKFANLRLFLCYMVVYPGKQLTFMGSEFGQFNEWNYEQQLEWGHLHHSAHRKITDFSKELNAFYLATPPLYENEGADGFAWISYGDSENQVLSMIRRDNNGGEVIAVLNMSPTVHRGYRIGVPKSGSYKEVFNSDKPEYMGSGVENGTTKTTRNTAHGQKQSITISLPPLGATFLVNNQETID